MAVGTPPWNPLQPPPFPVRRFTVDEYHRMIRAGLLTEDDRVELLEGWIVLKMPRNPPHDATVEIADETLRPRLPAGWSMRVQSAITTPESEPEPDLVVVQGGARDYLSRHPGPADIGLLIEVSDSSLSRDRNEKGRLFARAGIPYYWIINLIDSRVEVYSDPSGPTANPAYRQRQDYGPADSVPLVLGGQVIALIAVRDLLP